MKRLMLLTVVVTFTGCGNDSNESPPVPVAPTVSLAEAARNGDVDSVKQHVAAGTDIDAKNATGSTPLDAAFVYGHAEVAGVLLEAGANLETKNSEQTTPLFNAAFFCHPKTVEVLLGHDANVSTTDKQGTPLIDVMAAPWETVAGIYQLVYAAVGLEFNVERIKKNRPVILKMLKEHVTKRPGSESAMAPQRTAEQVEAIRERLPPIAAADWSTYNHDVRGWRYNSAGETKGDGDAIDAVIRHSDESFITVQIKARSKTCKAGDGALFSAIQHELRQNYWFVFYSERMDTTWIMTSEEFIAGSHQNKKGKNAGKRSIWFNGRKTDRKTKVVTEHCKPQFLQYIATDFGRLAKT